MIKELVEYIAQQLVDDPTQVTVTETMHGSEVRADVQVAPEEVGRLIGRQGKVINAIRTLAQLPASHANKRAQVELL